MKRPIKHNIIIILTLFVVMFGISLFRTCSNKDKQTEMGPEETLEAFYKELCAGEFDCASSLCDSLTMSGHINDFRMAWEKNDSTVSDIASAILSELSVTVTDVEKDGQTRTIFYELSIPDKQSKEKVATLSKEEGAWTIEKITDRI